jgi:hypothetical protein
MMMKNKFYLLSSILVIAITALPFFAMAQDPGGGPEVPIDGGLSLLLAAGAAYGVKKYRDVKKAKRNEEPDLK